MLLDVVKRAEGTSLRGERGKMTKLELLPPLDESQLRVFESGLPCPLPGEVRELLAYCSGLTGEFGDTVAEVRFSGTDGFGMEEVFPHCVDVAHDGAGNFWVVDLVSDSTTWAPVFYACHDPPVILFQTDSFAHFLSELLKLGNPPWESELRYVHEDEAGVWRTNPGMLTREQCLASGDADLEAFAHTLEEAWLVKDLRRPALGDGFSWGLFGARTELRRFGEKRIFAYRQPEKRGVWQRLRGR